MPDSSFSGFLNGKPRIENEPGKPYSQPDADPEDSSPFINHIL
jgi:hypothetical protein